MVNASFPSFPPQSYAIPPQPFFAHNPQNAAYEIFKRFNFLDTLSNPLFSRNQKQYSIPTSMPYQNFKWMPNFLS